MEVTGIRMLSPGCNVRKPNWFQTGNDETQF